MNLIALFPCVLSERKYFDSRRKNQSNNLIKFVFASLYKNFSRIQAINFDLHFFNYLHIN